MYRPYRWSMSGHGGGAGTARYAIEETARQSQSGAYLTQIQFPTERPTVVQRARSSFAAERKELFSTVTKCCGR